MAYLVTTPEPRSFGRDRSSASHRLRRPPIEKAMLDEVGRLQRQLARHSALEAAIRLRALSELEAILGTDELCGMAAEAS